MERRSLLMAGATMVLGGCATGGHLEGPGYSETIHSLATTYSWDQIIVFGEHYDYDLAPSEQLVQLLKGPLRSRMAADFRNARLRTDNSLYLSLRLTMLEADMSEDELRKFPKVVADLPGRRELLSQALFLRRFLKAPQDSYLAKPTNAPYVVQVSGFSDEPTRRADLSGRVGASILLVPIALLFLIVGGAPMPSK